MIPLIICLRWHMKWDMRCIPIIQIPVSHTFYSQYKIFVAEVASTCNEVLLMEYLLKNTTDKRSVHICSTIILTALKGTVYRQTMFAEYEMLSNKMVEEGESLTAETLNKLYYDLNCKYFWTGYGIRF